MEEFALETAQVGFYLRELMLDRFLPSEIV